MSTLSGLPASYGYMSIVTHFPFFIGGIVSYLLLRNLMRKAGFFEKRSTKIIGLALIGLAILLASLLIFNNQFLSFLIQIPYVLAWLYIWILVYICLVIGLILFPFKIFVNRIIKFLGDRSYSIYLLHPFLISLSMPVYFGIYGWVNDIGAAFLISFLYTVIMVLIFSSITYRFIEQGLMKYGNLLLKKLKERSSRTKKLGNPEILLS